MSHVSLQTAATLLQSHVAYTTEPTERPLPYRTRRRRAGVYRICIAVACTSLAALPALIAASYG